MVSDAVDRNPFRDYHLIAVRTLLATAILCASLVLTLSGCRSDSKSNQSVPRSTTTGPKTDSALARAHTLFQTCKVKQTVSLHNGTFYLELRDGSRVNLPKRIEKAIYAEVTHLPRRCPRITSSME